jgi:tetratricopeptide (TPR) repeat protein
MKRAWKLGPGLREEPVDPDGFAAEVDRLLEEITTARSQPAKLLAMLGEAAPLLRIAGRLEDSRKTAAAAIALAELVEDPISAFRGRIALAQVMQREGRFELATPLYDQLIAQARSSPALVAFLHDVLFSAGTNLFDQQRPAEAARYFRESQSLRRADHREDLLEMSAEALRLTASRASTRDS